MGRARNVKGKIEEDEEVEERKPFISVSSDDEDDDEANEDLSLKIVEKSLRKRATKLAENENQEVDFVHDNACDNNSSGGVGVFHGGDGKVVENGLPSSSQDAEAVAKKKRKKKNKVQTIKTGDQHDVSSEEKDKEGTPEKMKNSKLVEPLVEIDENANENADTTNVQTTDNMVLRKLLRGRRYFDPPDSGWSSCYNCGEDGHMAVNCPSFQKKKKPCFLCGSLEHGYKQCSKERTCSICKTPGHRPKKCPEKHKGGPLTSNVCLKCGDSGHDMFSCENSYAADDLKEIQCYICKNFGHLCCVNIFNNSPREVSCYKCGELGHTGLDCPSQREEAITKAPPNTSCYKCGEGGHFARECTTPLKTSQHDESASPNTCYRCGEGGHFARECITSFKTRKSNNDFSSPLKPHRDKKGSSGLKSAPELGKHQRRKTKSEDQKYMTPQKPKQRGGWIMDDPGDMPQSRRRKTQWGSPSTPYYTDFNFMPDGQASGSHSSQRMHRGYVHVSSSQPGKRMRMNGEVHHSNDWRHGSNRYFYHSRFDNSGNGSGYRSNYGGW